MSERGSSVRLRAGAAALCLGLLAGCGYGGEADSGGRIGTTKVDVPIRILSVTAPSMARAASGSYTSACAGSGQGAPPIG